MITLAEALIGRKNERNASSFHNGKWIDANMIEYDDIKIGYILSSSNGKYYVVVPRELGEKLLTVNLHTTLLDTLFIRYDETMRTYYFVDPRQFISDWPRYNRHDSIEKVFINEMTFKTENDIDMYVKKDVQNILTRKK